MHRKLYFKLKFILIIVQCVAFLRGVASFSSSVFTTVRQSSLDGASFRDVQDVTSNVDCARKCTEHNCDVMKYDPVNMECRFFSWLDVGLVAGPGQPERIWRRPEIRMVSGRYHDNRELTFAEAGQLCQSFGGRLITVSEIYGLASEQVFDMCRCGWVSEQQSIRLLVTSQVGCPPALYPGVNVCRDSTSMTYTSTPYARCTFDYVIQCGWVSEQQSIRLLVTSEVGCPPALYPGVNVCRDSTSTTYTSTPYAWCTFDYV